MSAHTIPEVAMALKSGGLLTVYVDEPAVILTAANLQLLASRVRVAEADRRSLVQAITELNDCVRWVSDDAIPETFEQGMTDRLNKVLRLLTGREIRREVESFEHRIAVLEATRNDVLEAYFKARPALDTPANRRLAEAGFARGWTAKEERLEI